jgi:hypothetical protein
MKISTVAVVAVVVAWLGLWATNTGLLVHSSDTGVLSARGCGYVVGVTVHKRLELFSARCPLVRKFGP